MTSTPCRQTIRATVFFLAITALFLSGTDASAQVAVAGAADTQPGIGLFTGDRGFSLRLFLSLNENFIGLGLSGCNGDPGKCTPGSTVSLQTVQGDSDWFATLDGASYTGGCGNCTAGLTFQIAGSVVMPPIAPTATATGRFTISGTLYPYPQPPITFSGAGTATLYLHSPGTPGFPNSWHVDRAVLRLDSPLPAPWSAVDVGVTGLPGTTTGTVSSSGDGTFTIAGAGADIWGTSDGFQFAYAWPAGPEIVARVDGEQNTNPFAKAGVMFRSWFEPNAPHVLLDVKPDGGVELLARATQGGPTTYVGGATMSFPVWLKLTESSGITTASVSSDGQTWQTVGSVGFAPRLPGLAVTSHDPSVLNQALFSHAHVQPDPNAPPPIGWQQTDVGSVSTAGASTIDGSQATISADGDDIWGGADAFRYVYQTLATDSEIVARVTSLQNTSPYAKAGVMMRTSTSATSPHVLLDVKPDGGVEFMTRTTDGSATSFIAGGFQAIPTWLRLQRRGTSFTGWVSADGVNWMMVGSVSVPGLTTGLVGLAVTSHAPGILTTATFDSISTNVLQLPPISSWFDSDIGTVGVAGRTDWVNGTFTVQGSGSDIWGTADSFHMLVSSASAPASLSTRVIFETNTNAYAKAGIMLRHSLTPASAFVQIDLKPNGEIEVLERQVDGGSASYVAGIVSGFPTFLKLDRAGSTVTASYSLDGTTWIPLAMLPVAWTANPTPVMGLAVTSHDPTQLNAAVFDTVVVQ